MGSPDKNLHNSRASIPDSSTEYPQILSNRDNAGHSKAGTGFIAHCRQAGHALRSLLGRIARKPRKQDVSHDDSLTGWTFTLDTKTGDVVMDSEAGTFISHDGSTYRKQVGSEAGQAKWGYLEAVDHDSRINAYRLTPCKSQYVQSTPTTTQPSAITQQWQWYAQYDPAIGKPALSCQARMGQPSCSTASSTRTIEPGGQQQADTPQAGQSGPFPSSPRNFSAVGEGDLSYPELDPCSFISMWGVVPVGGSGLGMLGLPAMFENLAKESN